MGVTSALSNGKKKIDETGGIMFEQYLRQSDVRGFKSINRCPKLSFVASSYDCRKNLGALSCLPR